MSNKGIDSFHLVWIVITGIVLLLLIGQVYKRVFITGPTGQQQVAQISSASTLVTTGSDIFRKDSEFEEEPTITCQQAFGRTSCKIKTLDVTLTTINARAAVGTGRDGSRGLTFTLDTPPIRGVIGGGAYVDFFVGTIGDYSAALTSRAITRDFVRVEPAQFYAFGADLQKSSGLSSLRSQITYSEWIEEDQKVRRKAIVSPNITTTTWTTSAPLEYQTTAPSERDGIYDPPTEADLLKLRKVRYYFAWGITSSTALSARTFSLDNATAKKTKNGGNSDGDATIPYCRDSLLRSIPRPQKCQTESGLASLGGPNIDTKGTIDTADDTLLLKYLNNMIGFQPPLGYNYFSCNAWTAPGPQACAYCKTTEHAGGVENLNGTRVERYSESSRLRNAGTLKCDNGTVINKCSKCGACPSTNDQYPGVTFDVNVFPDQCCAALPTSNASGPFLLSLGASQQCTGVIVSTITNACHSAKSSHYNGCAVDLNIRGVGEAEERSRTSACISSLLYKSPDDHYDDVTKKFPIDAGECKYHDGHMHCKTCNS